MLRKILLGILFLSVAFASDKDSFESDNLMMVDSELSDLDAEETQREWDEEKINHQAEKPRLLGELTEMQASTRRTKQRLEDIKLKIRLMQQERQHIQALINKSEMDRSGLKFEITKAVNQESSEKQETKKVYLEFFKFESELDQARRQKALADQRVMISKEQLRDIRKILKSRRSELTELHRDVILAKSDSRKNHLLIEQMVKKAQREVIETNKRIADMKKQLLSFVKVAPKLLNDLDKSERDKKQAKKKLINIRLKVQMAKLEFAKQNRLLSSLKKKHQETFKDYQSQKSEYQAEVREYKTRRKKVANQLAEIDRKLSSIMRAAFKYKKAKSGLELKNKILNTKLDSRKKLWDESRMPASEQSDSFSDGTDDFDSDEL